MSPVIICKLHELMWQATGVSESILDTLTDTERSRESGNLALQVWIFYVWIVGRTMAPLVQSL